MKNKAEMKVKNFKKKLLIVKEVTANKWRQEDLNFLINYQNGLKKRNKY